MAMVSNVIPLFFKAKIVLVLAKEVETHPFASVYLTSDMRPSSTNTTERNVSSAAFMTDDYRTRLMHGTARCSAKTGTYKPDTRNTKGVYETTIDCAPLLYLDKDVASGVRRVAADSSSLCVQTFCEVHCSGRKVGTWGCHTCGWGAITLYELQKYIVAATDNHSVTVSIPLSDQGPTPTGARGAVTLSIDDVKTLRTLRSMEMDDSLSASRIDESRGVVHGVNNPTRTHKPSDPATRIFSSRQTLQNMKMYQQTTSTWLTQKGMSMYSSSIQATRLPLYYTCGRCMVRPACAFIMTTAPQLRPEAYYLKAVSAALARRYSPGIAHEAERVKAALGAPLHEKGAILMDICAILSSTCTYFFDETLRYDMHGIEPDEDFHRLAELTMTGDCEDMAYTILSHLWDILETKTWSSEFMAEMHRVRLQYVATIALKAVTSPMPTDQKALPQFSGVPSTTTTTTPSSTYNRNGYKDTAANDGPDDSEDLLGHDTCDLIPIEMLRNTINSARLQKANTADISGDDVYILEEIYKERLPHLVPRSEGLNLPVVLGEGTVRTLHFSTKKDHVCDGVGETAYNRTKRYVLSLFRKTLSVNATGIFLDDLRQPSDFYKYSVLALLHDTLVYCRRRGLKSWKMPQLTFVSRHKRTKDLRIAVVHEDYVNGNFMSVVSPPLSEALYSIMHNLEKFEHPETSYCAKSQDGNPFPRPVSMSSPFYRQTSSLSSSKGKQTMTMLMKFVNAAPGADVCDTTADKVAHGCSIDVYVPISDVDEHSMLGLYGILTDQCIRITAVNIEEMTLGMEVVMFSVFVPSLFIK
jgi:hypothetical protein